MKKLQKVLSLLLSLLVTAVFFGPAALAAEPALTAAVTVTGFEETGVTYKAYQLLELTETWQNNTSDAFRWTDWVSGGFLPGSSLAGTTVQDFLSYENNAGPIRTFAEQAKSYVTQQGTAAVREGSVSGSALRLDGLTAGSYLLLFADPGATIYSPMILSLAPQVRSGAWVLDDVTAVVKKTTPAIEKEVKKVGDGDESYSNSKSASVGDTMQYRIMTTVPVFDGDVTDVVYRITDTMSPGLTYRGNLEICGEAGGALTPLREGTDYRFTLNSDQEFKVDFTYENLLPFSNVIVTFHAVINEHAQVETGNPNVAQLDFQNHSYLYTASNTAEITLYQVDALKVDAVDDHGLPGARFTIGTKQGDTVTLLRMVQTGDGTYRPAVGDEAADTEMTTGTGEAGRLSIAGLGSGVYVLTETKAPDGYATPQGDSAKSVFEIRHADRPALVLNGGEPIYASSNHFSFKVLNNTGFTLPVTGGTGSLLFYAAGIGVFALAILLVVRWNKKK